MELKCPQCGKWMAVSQEELVLHDCQVVCPQCLAVCHYENGALVVRDDSDAPYRHNASVSTPKVETTSYCHGCGKKLPEGISFCPYCGVDLKTPFVIEPVPEPEPEIKTQEPIPAPAEESRHEDVKAKSEPVPDRPVRESSQVEEKLRTMTHSYRGMQHRMDKDDKPSTAFKVIAYAVILLLLALLVYIIYLGLSIEQPTI